MEQHLTRHLEAFRQMMEALLDDASVSEQEFYFLCRVFLTYLDDEAEAGSEEHNRVLPGV